MNGKIYLIVIDGGADRPIELLGNKTPFEAAHTPNLDYLAKYGQQGLITIISPNICPESDNGIMSLLSYDPTIYYTGRGPLEGVGAGFLDKKKYSVCFRVNFASYNAVSGKLDRRTSRDLSDKELQALARELREKINLSKFGDITFDLMVFGRHRGVLCLSSDTLELSGNVSNTDPGFRKDGAFGIPVDNFLPIPKKCLPLDDQKKTILVSEIINFFIKESSSILDDSIVNKMRILKNKLPANMLLFRDSGDMPINIPSFYSKYSKSLFFYGQIPAERGLLILLDGGFDYCIQKEDQDDNIFFNLSAQKVISTCSDIVGIHIVKGADEAGHDKKPQEKVNIIEKFDSIFMKYILEKMNPEDVCVVTCDHATPCEIGIHSSDPVPVIVYGKYFFPDSTNAFGESHASSGEIPVKVAINLMPYIIKTIKSYHEKQHKN